MVADTTPQSFRLVKQAEKPAPLAQGSRGSRSVRLAEHRGAEKSATFALRVAAVGAVKSPLRFSRCSNRAQAVLKIFSQCSNRAQAVLKIFPRCSSRAQIPISSAVLAPEELIQLSAADLALSRSKAMRAKRASRLSNFISGRTKESRNTKTFFP